MTSRAEKRAAGQAEWREQAIAASKERAERQAAENNRDADAGRSDTRWHVVQTEGGGFRTRRVEGPNDRERRERAAEFQRARLQRDRKRDRERWDATPVLRRLLFWVGKPLEWLGFALFLVAAVGLVGGNDYAFVGCVAGGGIGALGAWMADL